MEDSHSKLPEDGGAIPDELIKFSLMAFLKHLFGLFVLYHSHLIIKTCLASLIEQVSRSVNNSTRAEG